VKQAEILRGEHDNDRNNDRENNLTLHFFVTFPFFLASFNVPVIIAASSSFCAFLNVCLPFSPGEGCSPCASFDPAV
jgi:hypothetical protein